MVSTPDLSAHPPLASDKVVVPRRVPATGAPIVQALIGLLMSFLLVPNGLPPVRAIEPAA